MPKLKNGWRAKCNDCDWEFDKVRDARKAPVFSLQPVIAFRHVWECGHTVRFHKFDATGESVYEISPVPIEDAE